MHCTLYMFSWQVKNSLRWVCCCSCTMNEKCNFMTIKLFSFHHHHHFILISSLFHIIRNNFCLFRQVSQLYYSDIIGPSGRNWYWWRCIGPVYVNYMWYIVPHHTCTQHLVGCRCGVVQYITRWWLNYLTCALTSPCLTHWGQNERNVSHLGK